MGALGREVRRDRRSRERREHADLRFLLDAAHGRRRRCPGEALGELRAGVGFQVAIIAASYGLDVEDDLARAP